MALSNVAEFKGYHITEKCIGCGTCIKHCPQRCIKEGKSDGYAA